MPDRRHRRAENKTALANIENEDRPNGGRALQALLADVVAR
jgi:hypothetical protein